MASKSVLSTVYVKSRVTATVNGSTSYNPTGDPVEIAFKSPGVDPVAPDWAMGSWETVGTSGYYARLLVGPGPGGLNLAVGTYDMWIRVTDNPEIPVMQAGPLRVY